MANNRLYIRCRQCGQTVFIGKHFGGSLSTGCVDIVQSLNEFYDKHFYCGNSMYSLELCEEFPCEMTENCIDSDGNVVLLGNG